MTHTVTKTFELTDEDVENIMESALRGMTYWADAAKIVVQTGKEQPDLFVSQALTHGYAIAIHDAEENQWEALTLRKFLDGVAQMEKLNYNDWDMYDADSAIQYALFGKQVYA